MSRYRDFMGYPVPWYSLPPGSVDRLIADRYFSIVAFYLRDGDRVFETYWTSGRGNEAMAPSYGLDDGRPAAQLSRIEAGRDDDLGAKPDGWTACSCSLHAGPPS